MLSKPTKLLSPLSILGTVVLGCSVGNSLPVPMDDIGTSYGTSSWDQGVRDLDRSVVLADITVDYDACMASTQTDPKNCGACGNSCSQSQACAGGKCLPSDKVLIIYAGDPNIHDIQDPLVMSGAFATVDALDGGKATPTSETLSKYNAVLVFSVTLFADATTLGNALATYFEGGGRVILAFGGIGLGGAFTDNYGLMAPENCCPGQPDQLGTVHDIGSPLLVGVVNFSSMTAYRNWGPLINNEEHREERVGHVAVERLRHRGTPTTRSRAASRRRPRARRSRRSRRDGTGRARAGWSGRRGA